MSIYEFSGNCPDCGGGKCQGHVQGDLGANGPLVLLPRLEADALAVVDRVEKALMGAQTGGEVLEVRDEAERMAVMASIQGFGKVANRLKHAVIWAERKWAELTPRSKPGPKAAGDKNPGVPNSEPSKKEKQSYRAAAVADREEVAAAMRDAEEAGTALTRKDVIRMAKPDAAPPPPVVESSGFVAHLTAGGSGGDIVVHLPLRSGVSPAEFDKLLKQYVRMEEVEYEWK